MVEYLIEYSIIQYTSIFNKEIRRFTILLIKTLPLSQAGPAIWPFGHGRHAGHLAEIPPMPPQPMPPMPPPIIMGFIIIIMGFIFPEDRRQLELVTACYSWLRSLFSGNICKRNRYVFLSV
jgi:hypothetical protein